MTAITDTRVKKGNEMDFLKDVLPTLATALGGPLAGGAVKFFAEKLGLPESTTEAVVNAVKTAPPEQLVAMKKIDADLKTSYLNAGVKLEELAVANTEGARKMQIATQSKIPGVLAIGVTLGFFGILCFMLTSEYKPSEPLLVMLGALGTAWGSVVNFYFGSSHGSQQKSALLAKADAIK